MKRLKLTLSNDEILHVTRNWYDVFLDGFGKTRFHQGKKVIIINDKFIIKREDDDDNG